MVINIKLMESIVNHNSQFNIYIKIVTEDDVVALFRRRPIKVVASGSDMKKNMKCEFDPTVRDVWTHSDAEWSLLSVVQPVVWTSSTETRIMCLFAPIITFLMSFCVNAYLGLIHISFSCLDLRITWLKMCVFKFVIYFCIWFFILYLVVINI